MAAMMPERPAPIMIKRNGRLPAHSGFDEIIGSPTDLSWRVFHSFGCALNREADLKVQTRARLLIKRTRGRRRKERQRGVMSFAIFFCVPRLVTFPISSEPCCHAGHPQADRWAVSSTSLFRTS